MEIQRPCAVSQCTTFRWALCLRLVLYQWTTMYLLLLAVQSFQLTSFPGRRQLPPPPGVVNLWHLPRVAENVNISSRLCTTFILFGCFRLCAFGRIWHSRDVTRCNKLSGWACQRWKWKLRLLCPCCVRSLNMSQLTELSHERLRWAASCAWTDHAGHIHISSLNDSQCI